MILFFFLSHEKDHRIIIKGKTLMSKKKDDHITLAFIINIKFTKIKKCAFILSVNHINAIVKNDK
jgi:hypothetical protein